MTTGSDTAHQGGGIDPEALHVDGFTAPEIDQGEAAPDDVHRIGQGDDLGGDVSEQITKEAFAVVWQQAFNLPGLIAPRWRPLAIQEGEEEPCRAASDAAYEILEIYWPSALHPAGEMAARLAVLAPFLLAKGLVVRSILVEMRAERLAPPRAANTDAPPMFQTSRAGLDDEPDGMAA